MAPATRPGELQPVTLHRPQADYSRADLPVAQAVDNERANPNMGWGVAPRQGEPHWAVFEVKDKLEFKEPMVARVAIQQNYRGGKHALGRFRVSLTDAAVPLPLGVSARAAELVAIPAEQRSPEQAAELAALGSAEDPERQKLAEELATAAAPLPVDPTLASLAADLADAEKPVIDDPAIVRLRSDVAFSVRQVADRRLTAIQDLAWALVNSPAFFFNH